MDDADELSKDNVYFIGVFDGQRLVGIGAVKILQHDITYGELKRIFILPDYRGQGLSKLLMASLEKYLMQQGVEWARLEAGTEQPEALGLYKKLGYVERGPYGQYKHDPWSIFLEKDLRIPDVNSRE